MKYKFNEEQYKEIKAARKANKDKQIDKRLEVLELRCEGMSQQQIAEKTDFHRSHVCNLIKIYFENGLQAVVEKHYVLTKLFESFSFMFKIELGFYFGKDLEAVYTARL